MRHPLIGFLAISALTLRGTELRSQECVCESSPLPLAQPFAVPFCPAPQFQIQLAPPPLFETRTVMVPQVVMQRQRVQVQEIQWQKQDRLVTVYDQVPEVVGVPVQETVLGYETRFQPTTTTVMQPMKREIMQTVNVPKTVYEDHLVERKVIRNDIERICKAVTRQKITRQFVPGRAEPIQTAEAPVTTYETEDVVKPRESIEKRVEKVAVTKNEARLQKQEFVEYQAVQQTVHVPVTVPVARLQTRSQPVLQYRTVARQVVQQEMVPVTVIVEKEIEVPVTQFVPQTIQTPVR